MGILSRPATGWPLDAALEPLVSTPERARASLETWLDRMAEWNAKVDLTAARDAGELVDLMIADAVRIAPHFGADARVVDVGTGAGAPGFALAMIRPDLKLTLVEPLAKRTSFLRTVLAEIGRADVIVKAGRVEDLAADAFDVAVSRATFAPAEWLTRALVLAPRAWVFLAKEPAPTATGAREITRLEYAWPNGGAQRTSVLYERT